MAPSLVESRDELACDISVIVPTYNRQLLLKRTLDSLVSQRAGDIRYEVLVVDNNSRDDTRALVEAFQRADPRVRYVFEGRQGVSHARNTGMIAARAPVLAFIDDDVEATPTWIAAIYRAFAAHPEIDCLGGPIRPRWTEPPPSWLTPMFWAAIAIQADKGSDPYIDAEHATPCLMTANFACRRRSFLDVGGFAVNYARDEDRELQLRMWAAGKRGRFVDDVEVVTEIPRERLTKPYHRHFYARVGQSHARMRYLDRIDEHGRLLRDIPKRTTLLGSPAFMYRRLLEHAAGVIWRTLMWQPDRAFYHETRLRYCASYIRTRRHEDQQSLRELPRELLALVTVLLRRPFRSRAIQSFGDERSEESRRSIRA